MVKPMNVGVCINTPAQVHFYRNITKGLEAHGHKVFTVARDYGETVPLLKDLGTPYYLSCTCPGPGAGKYASFPEQIARTYRYLKENKVDIVTGYGFQNTIAARLLGKPDIIFSDSEPGVYPLSYSLFFWLSIPLTNAVITPACYWQNLGRKHIYVDSYKELSYLHPNHFCPNRDVLELLGVSPGEDYALLRFNGFDAVHDIRASGFSHEQRIRLVKELEKYVRVFISSETGVPAEIRDRTLRIPMHRIHDAIYYARLLVTDGGTMGTEAAVLGTPTVRAISFARNGFGVFRELEEKYGLLSNYVDPEAAIEKAVELVQRIDVRQLWAERHDRLIRDKIDIASFMVWFIEHYPGSISEFHANPGLPIQFGSQSGARTIGNV
jgi:uncharacterized protein